MVKKGNLTVQSSGRSLCTTFPIRKSVPQSAVNPQYNTDIPRKIILQTSRLLNTTRRNYGRATGKQKNVSPSAERTTFVVTLISLHIIQLNKICKKKLPTFQCWLIADMQLIQIGKVGSRPKDLIILNRAG